jgi:membrane protein insertase, YidC/Oxa1 family, N-terminal domain
MNEQKNLYLAIGISIAIIIFFQILLPSQPIQSPDLEGTERLEPATSIDEQTNQVVEEIQSRENIINKTKRISFKNSSIEGSINLKGAIIDDLILSKYKTSLEPNSKNIQLLLPDGTANPYYIETGWKELKDTNIDLPDIETVWESDSLNLTPSNPVSLTWTNNQNVTFKVNYSIDEEYMFSITQEITNNGNNPIEVFPYRLIKRINTPDTINFFILHEGLISLINDELLEKNYDDMAEDCTSSLQTKKSNCDNKSQGGG